MLSNLVKYVALAALILAPITVYAAEGDPGTGQGKGSEMPASQPAAPTQQAPVKKDGSAKMNEGRSSDTANPDVNGGPGKMGEGQAK